MGGAPTDSNNLAAPREEVVGSDLVAPVVDGASTAGGVDPDSCQ